MLLTYFLCGFIVEPAIHCHNLRAKSMRKIICLDYQMFILNMPEIYGVENGERMWKHSPKSWGM